MEVVHISADVAQASGVGTFVRRIDGELRARGVASSVVTTLDELRERFGARETARGDPVRDGLILHIHGIWLKLHRAAARLARARGIPVVWSTHGMTAPWAMRHKWWKKLPAWWLYQRRDLRGAAVIHCTTELEAGWNRALGLGKACVVPLGTVLPREKSKLKVEVEERRNKVLLFVGRIYPVKALDNVVRAAALMKRTVRFRIVGPDQAGHLAELERLAAELGVRDRFDFVGPKFDAELAAEYDGCDGLILVSHTENFGATVADAMAHGKPVVTSVNTPWKVVADRGCGWWVENDAETLARTFDVLAETSDGELARLGRRGRALVEERYTWSAVGGALVRAYRDVLAAREDRCL